MHVFTVNSTVFGQMFYVLSIREKRFMYLKLEITWMDIKNLFINYLSMYLTVIVVLITFLGCG